MRIVQHRQSKRVAAWKALRLNRKTKQLAYQDLFGGVSQRKREHSRAMAEARRYLRAQAERSSLHVRYPTPSTMSRLRNEQDVIVHALSLPHIRTIAALSPPNPSPRKP